MKIKRDFVTNSSSTSYVVIGYKVETEKSFGDGYYDDQPLQEYLVKKFHLPKELDAFDLHYGIALVGIVITGMEGGDSAPLSKIKDKLDRLEMVAKKNNWKDEPRIFFGERSSGG